MIEFLESEIAEIDAVRAAVDEAAFNSWFDNSEIKARFKKACMMAQRLRCCYCKRFFDTVNNNHWDLEHVLCERDYPQFFATPGNLAVACKDCNNAKSQEDVLRPQPHPPIADLPTESISYSIPHPCLDQWDSHMRHVNYQIYTSIGDKGTELISVCKLNKRAVELGGLTYDTLVAAIKANYFDLIDNPVDTVPPDDHILAAMARVQDGGEELRIQARLTALSATLAGLDRKAKKRKVETAIAKAEALAAKKMATREQGNMMVRVLTAIQATPSTARAEPVSGRSARPSMAVAPEMLFLPAPKREADAHDKTANKEEE
jgi:hypothetical protein